MPTTSIVTPTIATALYEGAEAYVGTINNTITADFSYYVSEMLSSGLSSGGNVYVGNGKWYFDLTFQSGYKKITNVYLGFGVAYNSVPGPNQEFFPGSIYFTFEGSTTEGATSLDITGSANSYPAQPNNYSIQAFSSCAWNWKTSSNTLRLIVDYKIYMADPQNVFSPATGTTQVGIDYVNLSADYIFLDAPSLLHTDY